MKFLKCFFTVFLVMALCAGLLVPLTGNMTAFAASPKSGKYAIVVLGIDPTGTSYPYGDYYITYEESRNPGLLFSSFKSSDVNESDFWQIDFLSSSQCTIQNPNKGDLGYLNISADTLEYGEKQSLNFERVSNKFRFYATVGGTKYYIRFTNSTNNESRFHAGTSVSNSCEFTLWEWEPELPTSDAAGLPLPEEDPIFTVACVSDMHADYRLQSQAPYIRNSVIQTMYRIAAEENADLVLVGGDSVSDNDRTAAWGGWTYPTYEKVVAAYREAIGDATYSGRSLWACGNHDHQAGQYEGYDSYEGFVDIMIDSCGEPLNIYYQKDDPSISSQPYPNHPMGIHYNLDGFDFLIINPPYSVEMQFSKGTMQWLESRLNVIGKDKTVFLLTHYPLVDSRGVDVPNYGMEGGLYDTFTGILKQYPNTIHLYGHNHGGTETVYISEDTFERITSYSPTGKSIHKRNVVPTSFISSFMGSMSYYNYSQNPGGLTAKDPKIYQALMIYVYKDRIVFQMKNYGNSFVNTNLELKPWTVLRNMEAYVEDPQDKPTDTSTDTSTDANGTITDTIINDTSDKTTDTATDKTSASVGESADVVTDSSANESVGSSDQPTDVPSDGTEDPSDNASDIAPDTDGSPSNSDVSDGSEQTDGGESPESASWILFIVVGSIVVVGGGFCLWYFLIRKRG